jgi:hypothetical protein
MYIISPVTPCFAELGMLLRFKGRLGSFAAKAPQDWLGSVFCRIAEVKL